MLDDVTMRRSGLEQYFPISRFLQMVVISPEVVGMNERAIERHENESY